MRRRKAWYTARAPSRRLGDRRSPARVPSAVAGAVRDADSPCWPEPPCGTMTGYGYCYAEEWGAKGTTFSDKTARAEFGLRRTRSSRRSAPASSRYRWCWMQGNPWLRLLRREVEDLVSTGHGQRYLREQQARAELKQVNRELKQHRAQLAALEQRRSALLAELGEQGALCRTVMEQQGMEGGRTSPSATGRPSTRSTGRKRSSSAGVQRVPT